MNVALSELFPVGEKEDLEDLESRFLGGTHTPFAADVETGSSEPPKQSCKWGVYLGVCHRLFMHKQPNL